MSQTRIGISGWRYAPWRGVFYPEDLAQKRELEYASRQLNSIEINGSFYSLQLPSSYISWRDATPEDFVFSVKGGRYITHMRRLVDIEIPLANFFASGILALNQKLGPILWQFPPRFLFREEKFRAFFELLPKSTNGAAKLAKKHDSKLKGRAYVKCDRDRPMRYAIEVRHEGFKDEAFVKLCREFNIAIVLADTAGKWPYMEDVTADFMYARLHGDKELYVSGYDDKALDWWAARFEKWRGGSEPANAKKIVDAKPPKRQSRDIYVYFDNDVKVEAPFDAMRLRHRLGGAEPSERHGVKGKPVRAEARSRWPGFGRR